MTVASRSKAGSGARSVVHEIAERRRADILAEVASTSLAAQLDAALASPRPRPVVEALAAPGLHLIAEIKRSSPSAGAIAAADDDIVARARAYEAGGATVISVLCEPHWFGGSVADLRAVRAAVSLPVLAKEFVVEEIQLPMLRAAGADLVLLLASLHDADDARPRLVERAREIGLEPLVEAHDERGGRGGRRQRRPDRRPEQPRPAARSSVDPERASRLRELVPDDRLVVAESGVRDAGADRAAGAPRGSMRRSSVRRSCGRRIRRRRSGRSSRPVASRTIRPTSRDARS